MRDADIVIIGAGVAGLTLAAELAPHLKVVVLEAEAAPGYHASGRSAALYEPGYGAPAVQALTAASLPHFQNAGLLSPRGVLLIGSEAEREAFLADAAAMSLPLLERAEVLARLPVLKAESLALAAGHDDAWDIDTDRLLQEALRLLRAAGGELCLSAKVSRIGREGEAWQVEAGGETFRAPRLVNAAGAWVTEIAGLAGVSGPKFQPYRRSMARIPAPEGADISDWPMILGVDESWYAKPDAGALIVSPCEAEPVDPHDAWADDMVLAEGLARYEAYVTQPVTRLLASWAGLRTFAPDKVLVIGPDPAVAGFYWQAGQGGYGFQTAPAAARLGADLILGRIPDLAADLVAALSPARFAKP